MSWDFIAVQGPFGGTSEGPAWDGESLLFTHIPESKISVGNIAALLINGASGISFSSCCVIGILVRESDIVRQAKKDTNATAEATMKAKEKLKLSAKKNPIGGAYN